MALRGFARRSGEWRDPLAPRGLVAGCESGEIPKIPAGPATGSGAAKSNGSPTSGRAVTNSVEIPWICDDPGAAPQIAEIEADITRFWLAAESVGSGALA